MNIDIDKLPLKYLTGSYKYESTYPTPLDLLYDLVKLEKEKIKKSSITWIDNELCETLLDTLQREGYIQVVGENIKIINTTWNG